MKIKNLALSFAAIFYWVVVIIMVAPAEIAIANQVNTHIHLVVSGNMIMKAIDMKPLVDTM